MRDFEPVLSVSCNVQRNIILRSNSKHSKYKTHSTYVCGILFPPIFLPTNWCSQKQRGRAQWGNISFELARTIIARGVEATARSRHNVGNDQFTMASLMHLECNKNFRPLRELWVRVSWPKDIPSPASV